MIAWAPVIMASSPRAAMLPQDRLRWRERGAWRKQSALFVAAALAGGMTNVCFVAALYSVLGGERPYLTITLVVQLLAFAAVWLVAAMWTTMYGVTHLEAGRAAVLLV